MATFANTLNPTPFGAFDSDTQFQSDADSMVTFVKRKLGDDKTPVYLCNLDELLKVTSVGDLLPGAFNLKTIK